MKHTITVKALSAITYDGQARTPGEFFQMAATDAIDYARSRVVSLTQPVLGNKALSAAQPSRTRSPRRPKGPRKNEYQRRDFVTEPVVVPSES